MDPRTTSSEPASSTDGDPAELDLAAIGLAVFFFALIAIVAALLMLPTLT